MAGPDAQYEYTKQIDLNSATAQGRFAPGCHPHILRRVGLAILNDVGATGIVLIKMRPTINSATGEVTVATLNLTTAHTAGKVVYADNLRQLVSPGGELVAEVTDVGAAGDLADVCYLLEPSWEQPANNARMVLSA